MLRALELSPNEGPTRHAYADYLMVMGDLEGSLEQVEIGLMYDPFSPMARSVVQYHRLFVRQYAAVIEDGREVMAGDPSRVVELPYYREALWLKGMHAEAYAAYKGSWGRDEELLQAMEAGYADAGYPGAVHSLAEVLAARVPGYDDYVTLAKLYARAGDTESALLWLEEAFNTRQPQILHIKAMPVFDDLRSEPAFQDLLRRIGFPEG